MKNYNAILVTGCGGDIPTGIGRILRESAVAKTLVGTDIRPDNAGTFVFDVCDILPRADNPQYFKEVEKIIKKYSIDLIIPMSEAEIRLWYRSGYTEMFAGVPVIMPNKEAFDVAIDKLVTAEFMKNYAISEGHKELWLYLKLELISILQSMGIMVQLPTISPLMKNKANDQLANTTVFTGSEIKSN